MLGVFAFAPGHGVAATVAFRLRSERDPSRTAAILDYSLWQLSPRCLMSIGLTGLVTAVAAGHDNKIRFAIAQKLPRDKTDAPAPSPLAPDQLQALLMASTPWSWLPSAASASRPFCSA